MKDASDEKVHAIHRFPAAALPKPAHSRQLRSTIADARVPCRVFFTKDDGTTLDRCVVPEGLVPVGGLAEEGRITRRGITARNISWAIASLRRQAPHWKTPFVELVASSTKDPFQVLLSCVLSLRTKDETTAEAATRLLGRAPTAQALAGLPEGAIARLIYPVGFYRRKARVLRSLARLLLKHHGGKVPDTMEELLAIDGVGRKTANLVLTRAFGKAGLCVDTHVHWIANRWGYVRTKTPERTEMALHRRLPRRHWIELNGLLVAFGQTICRPLSPLCSRCPLSAACAKREVAKSRQSIWPLTVRIRAL